MNMHTSLIWIIILFDEAFKHGDGAKFWGYVETNAEPLRVEFCNFVHTVVKYLHVIKFDKTHLQVAR
jgi:hypothetical protein